ncbi:hypothetical protein H4R24_000134 [Coemansia sp. RSA 988]|nr:hypothetical protein H4R24_000134 [Coemansia sp. RSA 988]
MIRILLLVLPILANIVSANPTAHTYQTSIDSGTSTAKVLSSSTQFFSRDTATTSDTAFREQEGQQRTVSGQEQDILALFAAYAGAAYTVTNEWNCQYACEYPGTQGTIIEHHWDIGFPLSAGYIARNPNGRVIVVAFQGTEDISQWIDNLNIAQIPWPPQISGSRVHAGFLRGYISVQDDIISKLKSLTDQYPNYSIAIVGHSLGGARAAICLLDMSIKMPELLSRMFLYTQGQPRTGNKEFANAIDGLQATKYREVYEYDIAPRMPLFSMGYQHHSTEAWNHNNQTLLCLTPTLDDGCSGNGDFLHPLTISDHFDYPGLKHE